MERMKLPENKKLAKITYEYENGDRFYIDKGDLRMYEYNIKIAETETIVHSGRFKKVNWNKEPK